MEYLKSLNPGGKEPDTLEYCIDILCMTPFPPSLHVQAGIHIRECVCV